MPFPLIAAVAAGGGLGLAKGLFNIDAAKQQAKAMVAKAQFEKDQAAKSGMFLNFNARVVERQAERDVKMLRRSGDLTQSRIEKEKRMISGSQRAAFAASGVDASFGSAALTRIESDLSADLDKAEVAYMTELDAITTKNNAWRQAYGFKLEAEAMGEQADFNLTAAREAGKAGVDSAIVSTFLSSIQGGMQAAQSASGIVAGTPASAGGMKVPSSPVVNRGYMGGGTAAGGFGQKWR